MKLKHIPTVSMFRMAGNPELLRIVQVHSKDGTHRSKQKEENGQTFVFVAPPFTLKGEWVEWNTEVAVELSELQLARA